ncbi:hypothetical protein GCM10025879_00990 [Leuconostoc litchii]|uniref:hypothetical protein n=1 Tax=Leuconostoc litchii TaxID=1981069 RepID=UPI0023E9E789|nr:hypothetical protein [Leuconostoc litchii]GMA68853.1 hypothetical protein GCM10025879_00990 [Leuconostoc litchii]
MGFDKSFDMEWDSMVHSSGEALVTNNGKVNVNSKKAIAAAKLIMDMVNDGTALTFSSSAGITATKAALAGNSLVVTATASKKQQSGAWAFMKFLMSDKQTEK